MKSNSKVQNQRPNQRLEAEDYYINAQGFIVFTETYHRKRGYCCRSGCLHCPYGFRKNDGDSLVPW